MDICFPDDHTRDDSPRGGGEVGGAGLRVSWILDIHEKANNDNV